jgi:hypothetical protein
MTSRNILWLALGAIGLPLLIEGTNGCSFPSPPPADQYLKDNAYTCGCTCEGFDRNSTLSVSTGSDDAEQVGSVMSLSQFDLDLGSDIVGVRFPAAGIPPGAVIKNAVVQFRARESNNVATDLQIVGQLSPVAPTFSAASNDLTSRPATAKSVAWVVAAWTGDSAGPNERTPDLAPLLQELVNQPNWSMKSAVVLRFQGTGKREAGAFELASGYEPQLIVNYNPGLHTELPVCATPEIVAQNDVTGKLPQAAAAADCQGRVATTLQGLASACGYAQQCSCDLVIPAMGDASFDRDVCDESCVPNQVDSTCGDFDPNGYLRCVMSSGNDETCKGFVSATHAGNAQPVCIATGRGDAEIVNAPSTSSYIAFNHLSTCEVAGSSHIEVGDREPTHDPHTVGTVQILGDPCPGGGCKVAASFALVMEPITFSVRFASDPTFGDLSALADSRATTMVNGVDAVFGADGVTGTGNGRRGSKGLALDGSNQEPLVVGIDWTAKLCDLTGNLAATVDGENPDGTCAGDGATPCTADSPDCDDVGGPCEFEDPMEEMTVDVAASGTLVNQPPSASAGADQTIECTSTSGASFTLQGTASDPDDNLAVISWRKGRVGPEVSPKLVTTQSLGVGATQDFVLRLIDTYTQTDEDDARIAVVDTTPPQLSVSVSPSKFSSPNHKLVTVKATINATDTCDAKPTVRLVSITSNEPDNGLGDGDQPKDIQDASFGTDDRQFQLRNERGGSGRGRIYTITYSATDASGNKTVRQATVTVPQG